MRGKAVTVNSAATIASTTKTTGSKTDIGETFLGSADDI